MPDFGKQNLVDIFLIDFPAEHHSLASTELIKKLRGLRQQLLEDNPTIPNGVYSISVCRLGSVDMLEECKASLTTGRSFTLAAH